MFGCTSPLKAKQDLELKYRKKIDKAKSFLEAVKKLFVCKTKYQHQDAVQTRVPQENCFKASDKIL